MAATVEKVLADPKFGQLSEAAQYAVLGQLDPKFKALSDQAKPLTMKALREKFKKPEHEDPGVWRGIGSMLPPIGAIAKLSPPGQIYTGVRDVMEGRAPGATTEQTSREVLEGVSQGAFWDPLKYAGKTGEAMLHGDVRGVVRNAPGMVPLIGPAAEAAADSWDRGEPRYAIGQSVSLIGQAMLPEVIEGAISAGVKFPSLLGGSKDPHVMMTKALKPPRGLTKFPENLRVSMPEIVATGRTIKGLDDLVTTEPGKSGAITVAKRANRAEYAKLVGPQVAANAMVDLSPVADARIASIPRKLWLENPQAAQRLVARANRYRGRFSIDDVDHFIRETNAELEGYYSRNPAARNVAGDPRTAALVAQANEMRTAMYNTLDAPGQGAAARILQRRYGALSEMERVAYNERIRAMRAQPEGMAEQIGYWSGLGKFASGAVRMLKGQPLGLADIAAGFAQARMAKWLQERNSTDSLIKRAFKDYSYTNPFVRMPPPPQPSPSIGNRLLPPASTHHMPPTDAIADAVPVWNPETGSYDYVPRSAAPGGAAVPAPDTSGPIDTPQKAAARKAAAERGRQMPLRPEAPATGHQMAGSANVVDVVLVWNAQTGMYEYVPRSEAPGGAAVPAPDTSGPINTPEKAAARKAAGDKGKGKKASPRNKLEPPPQASLRPEAATTEEGKATAATPPPQPRRAAPAGGVEAVANQMLDAMRKIDPSGENNITFQKLRDAMPGVDRETFDAAARLLHTSRRAYLTSPRVIPTAAERGAWVEGDETTGNVGQAVGQSSKEANWHSAIRERRGW